MGNITKISQLNDKEVTEEVYSKFFATSEGFKDVDIVCNNKNKSGEMTSFSFSNTEATLKRIFHISKNRLRDVVKNKYMGTANKDILTLHSSALLALLVFYKVDKDNPIVIEGVKYNNVLFEVENKVIGHPSQVDVLLISEDGKTLLFLESKFTELFKQVGDKRGLKYKDYYKLCSPYIIEEGEECAKEGYTKLKYNKVTNEKGGVEWFVEGHDSEHYCYGITQMIAHFIGLCKGPAESENITYREIFDKADNLILGEILFDFPDEYKEMRTKINDYAELYKGLTMFLKKEEFLKIGRIKNDKKDKKIDVLKNVLTYQDILNLDENKRFKKRLDRKVKNFYHF